MFLYKLDKLIERDTPPLLETHLCMLTPILGVTVQSTGGVAGRAVLQRFERDNGGKEEGRATLLLQAISIGGPKSGSERRGKTQALVFDDLQVAPFVLGQIRAIRPLDRWGGGRDGYANQ